MKKIFISLIILSILFPTFIIINIAKVNKVLGDEKYFENCAKEQIKNFVYKKFYNIYNIKDINYTIEVNNKSNIILLVKVIYTLKLDNIEDHPVINAYEKFLNNDSLKGSLSYSKRKFLEKQLNLWKENIISYINKNQELNIRFKIILDTNKFYLYIEDPFNNFIEADKYIEIKSYKEIEEETYKNLIEINSDPNFKISNTKYYYNPSLSVNYANTYTSNTSKKVWCSSDPNDWVYQDKNYYNPNYYAYCADCANYVSQSIYAGGINTDSTWRPYTYAWINCIGLNDYMWSNYCYLTYYRPYAIPGSICMIDQNNNGNPDHTTLIVYNDGSILKYSAHTHDRKQYILPNLSFQVWFLVFY
jgi:hypothetical protein